MHSGNYAGLCIAAANKLRLLLKTYRMLEAEPSFRGKHGSGGFFGQIKERAYIIVRLGNFVPRTVEAGQDIRYNVTYIWKYL
ncbi:hypothetical protein BBD42_06090 [Paenibacillus sp. BIHB 4019]|uniref:Uncharacterized protein n=1 Tax=Paenibacillus sp. BIHB 4019 TaxID=1870819 RepID=A0A1B2DEE5_9BACL|nr:hypothetical protein BBD42_06090 [Paenibacillus sp. BIHB 4019]